VSLLVVGMMRGELIVGERLAAFKIINYNCIPAHATNIKPPTCELNQIQIFNGTSWNIIEDRRGTYYSTQTQQVIENDNPLETPENSTKEFPPEVADGYKLNWNNKWVLEELPPLPPPPVLTPEEKLAQSGLTVEELKGLLGLN
jgi:hypothetical protein